MEACFLAYWFLDSCIHFGNLGYTENGVSVAQRKIRNHFSIEIPPQNLHSTHLDQRLTTLKCCFGYPLIFGKFEAITKIKKPIQQNMFDHKATIMVLIVLDL